MQLIRYFTVVLTVSPEGQARKCGGRDIPAQVAIVTLDHHHARHADLRHCEQVKSVMNKVANDAVAQQVCGRVRRKPGRLRGSLERPLPCAPVPGLSAAAAEEGGWGSLFDAASANNAGVALGSLIRRSWPALSWPILITPRMSKSPTRNAANAPGLNGSKNKPRRNLARSVLAG